MLRCFGLNSTLLIRVQQHAVLPELTQIQQRCCYSSTIVGKGLYFQSHTTTISSNNTPQLLAVDILAVTAVRNSGTSFFTKVSAAQLWKGVTSVSNAGRKRGRGKGVGKKSAKDLNRGQVIGVGKANIVWPGLNAPIIRGKELVPQRQLPPDPEREAKLIKMRDTMGKFKPLRLSPLERGWSGSKMHGRSVGPPDPIGQDSFVGFDTKILEMKTVTNMDGNMGRCKRFSCVAFTGNKDGLAGFALGKSPEGRSALTKAKNRAGQKLLYIQRYKDHTVLHDFFTQFGPTKIFVYKKPEGFGLVCHRAIRTMCELIGIKDLYAKIEGPTTVQNIIKAFMLGLLRQKSHDDLANQKQLYLVEQRPDMAMFPSVIGVPQTVRSPQEISTDEILDFQMVGFDDRLPLRKKKYPPFYTKQPSWERHLLKTEWRRNHGQVRVKLLAEYGGENQHCRSHLSQDYPEADAFYAVLLKRKKDAEEEAVE